MVGGPCCHPAGNEGPAPALPLEGFGDSDMPGALTGGTAAGPARHACGGRPGEAPLSRGLAFPFSSTAPGSERCTCAGWARSRPCTPCCSAADRSGVSGPGKAARRRPRSAGQRLLCVSGARASTGRVPEPGAGSSHRVHSQDSQACGLPGDGPEPVKDITMRWGPPGWGIAPLLAVGHVGAVQERPLLPHVPMM